ncbi:hypothetical protein [Pseudomonas oryzihabitans]|uniref:Uncharacterized protein n=1 Tax=Pseudomonas oryzihabitans TaxID=47885 RepID=A0AAJ2BTZ0_9PSED|nr:hypothetical protein [Pseudomonas psychrotolerans]MDR6232898.1 hypothetical protein [Pseudomonas psychrotolerans]MDR6358147.1 hypothetical protein [Pseudomonas psychrotolerans]
MQADHQPHDAPGCRSLVEDDRHHQAFEAAPGGTQPKQAQPVDEGLEALGIGIAQLEGQQAEPAQPVDSGPWRQAYLAFNLIAIKAAMPIADGTPGRAVRKAVVPLLPRQLGCLPRNSHTGVHSIKGLIINYLYVWHSRCSDTLRPL